MKTPILLLLTIPLASFWQTIAVPSLKSIIDSLKNGTGVTIGVGTDKTPYIIGGSVENTVTIDTSYKFKKTPSGGTTFCCRSWSGTPSATGPDGKPPVTVREPYVFKEAKKKRRK